MPIKGNGEGFVFYNKQRKKWNAQYREYDARTGEIKPRTKSFKTEEEAKQYLRTIMYQKENPVYIEHHGIPICEVMRANLKLKQDTNQITPTQFTRVSDTITKLEKTPIGRKNVDQITSEEIQEYLNSIKNLSNSSISKLYGQLNQAFKIAINKGYLMRNPMVNVIRPKSIKEDKEVRALTVEEQQIFTEYLLQTNNNDCKYKNVYLIQMYMGLRIGETLALTTHDINLRDKRINIYRTLTTDGNRDIVMGNRTKTYSGKRVLPIPDFLYPYIVEQMEIAEKQERNEEKLLFKPKYSNYTRRKNVNYELKRICEDILGVNDITTHNLRHTYGTRCIEARYATCCSTETNGT